MGGGMGGGMGMRGGHAGHGSHGGAARGKHSDASPMSPTQRRQAAIQRMDDNDAAAYIEAESVLSETQRETAREIASRYREELWDWRQAMQQAGLAADE
jgi:hypothetical protein